MKKTKHDNFVEPRAGDLFTPSNPGPLRKATLSDYTRMFTYIFIGSLVYIAIHIVGLIISYILPFIY
jgi:hypothetical protein